MEKNYKFEDIFNIDNKQKETIENWINIPLINKKILNLISHDLAEFPPIFWKKESWYKSMIHLIKNQIILVLLKNSAKKEVKRRNILKLSKNDFIEYFIEYFYDKYLWKNLFSDFLILENLNINNIELTNNFYKKYQKKFEKF